MQIKQISFYHDFQCVGAACSVNCCRGWKVPIDNAMYLKYMPLLGRQDKVFPHRKSQDYIVALEIVCTQQAYMLFHVFFEK